MTRILIVDDSPTMRRIIATNLKSAGFDGVTEAADGRLALAKLREAAVDLLIVDWAMPEMTGLELLCAVRSTPSLRDVLLLSFAAISYTAPPCSRCRSFPFCVTACPGWQ